VTYVKRLINLFGVVNLGCLNLDMCVYMIWLIQLTTWATTYMNTVKH